MSDERIIPLRNRAVHVVIYPCPEADLPSTSPAMDGSGNDPIGPDLNATKAGLDRRVEAMEHMLRELALRLTATSSQPDSVPPVAQMSQVSDDLLEGSNFIRNRRYQVVLAVSTYRLRNQTTALRPDQMMSLSTTAALIRPRLEGSFFLDPRPWLCCPF
jgi:hypothetical protein